jgi:Fur family peroxide stress response transcriptional regulator
MRPTPQRDAIYRALVEAHDHPSPEVICARVRRAMPALSLATVYKTLEVLVRLGLADELPATGKTKRYDANMDRHHHVVCTRCGVVRDHYDAALDRLAEATRLRGFTVHRVSVHIHGQCERCARAAESRQPQSIRRRRSWPRS